MPVLSFASYVAVPPAVTLTGVARNRLWASPDHYGAWLGELTVERPLVRPETGKRVPAVGADLRARPGFFPNRAAIIRLVNAVLVLVDAVLVDAVLVDAVLVDAVLVDAVLVEQADEWAETRRYMGLELLT